MSPFDIFQQLKEGTAVIHQQIEERVPVFRPGFDLEDYVELLERFYGFWTPLEIQLSKVKALEHPELELASRMKSGLLINDLLILGRDPDTLPRCEILPSVNTFLSGIGCLYVLEGSTLGARLISKRIGLDLQLKDGSGGSFFNAYGESVGRRWTEFRNFVTPRVGPDGAEETVAAARQTFQCFYEWLGAQ